MSRRMLDYSGRLLLACHNGGFTEAAFVVSVVLYTGKQKYRQPSDVFANLSPEERHIAKEALGTVYAVHLQDTSDEKLLGESASMSDVLQAVLKYGKQTRMLPLAKKVFPHMHRFQDEPGGDEFTQTLLTYLTCACQKDEENAILKVSQEELGKEAEGDVMRLAQAWELRGVERGLEQGLEQGKLEKALEIARKLLKQGLDLKIITQATGLSVRKITAMTK